MLFWVCYITVLVLGSAAILQYSVSVSFKPYEETLDQDELDKIQKWVTRLWIVSCVLIGFSASVWWRSRSQINSPQPTTTQPNQNLPYRHS